jgi:hypothetical protein
MPKKLEYEYVKNEIEKESGYKLLSKTYTKNSDKLKIKCPDDHIFYSIYNNFKAGRRCKQCSLNKRKLDINDVINYIESKGYKYISGVYENNCSKLTVKCPKDHTYDVIFNSFKDNNNRCKICAGLVKHSYEHVKSTIESTGYILLSTEYKNANTKLEMKCPAGHKSERTFGDFQYGYKCRECFYKSISGENHTRWNIDRTRDIRRKFLSFHHSQIHILSDDPNYNDFLNNKYLAKHNRKHRHDLRNIYEVDHIFPRAAFVDNDFDIKYDKAIIKSICNLRENLRIITRTENSDKRAKYNQDEFLTWFNLRLKEYENENSQSPHTQEAVPCSVT